jgi:hypothetical protein
LSLLSIAQHFSKRPVGRLSALQYSQALADLLKAADRREAAC